MALSTIIGAITLGLILSILALGIYISFRILDTPDLTVDGSFVTGAAISVMFAINGQPILGLIFAFIGGCIAGIITGILQTKFKIQPILAGILTMTGLYSINLRIMNDTPYISLFGENTIYSYTESIFKNYNELIITLIIVVLITVILNWLFKTQLGVHLRATGDNEDMVRASSINTDLMKIIGLSIANGLVGISGGLFTQQQTFADLSSGIGMLVIGLASVIVGEAIIKSDKTIYKLIAVIIGAILYRFILTIALQLGLPASDLKLVSAILVTFAICIPVLKVYLMKRGNRNARA